MSYSISFSAEKYGRMGIRSEIPFLQSVHNSAHKPICTFGESSYSSGRQNWHLVCMRMKVFRWICAKPKPKCCLPSHATLCPLRNSLSPFSLIFLFPPSLAPLLLSYEMNNDSVVQCDYVWYNISGVVLLLF